MGAGIPDPRGGMSLQTSPIVSNSHKPHSTTPISQGDQKLFGLVALDMISGPTSYVQGDQICEKISFFPPSLNFFQDYQKINKGFALIDHLVDNHAHTRARS